MDIPIPGNTPVTLREDRESCAALNKGTDFPGYRCVGGSGRERRDEDAMKRQCEDYRLVASRPIIVFSLRVLPGAPVRSRGSQKGAFSHGNASTTLGAGLIERNE